MANAPVGAIAIWSGTLLTIPANWNLCNGTGGTPDLRDKFIKGAADSVEAGDTGGNAGHSHTEVNNSHDHSTGNDALQSKSHNHTTNTSGAHNHTLSQMSQTRACADATTLGTTGGHTHTVNNASHFHTVSAASHNHTINSTADTRPPYYDVLFLQAAAGAAIATNIKLIWTGLVANIPANWSEFTSLREKFIRGASNGVDGGGTGGAATHIHTTTAAAAHNHGGSSQSKTSGSHTFNQYSVAHNHGPSVNKGYGAGNYLMLGDSNNNFVHTHANTNAPSNHMHSITSEGAHTHGDTDPASSLPGYTDIVFINNDAAVDIPLGGVLMWAGLLADIPSGYVLCDGSSGTLDLRGQYIRGVKLNDPVGGTGGSNTHDHTVVAAGTHVHTIGNSGTHTHTATDSIGAHQHSQSANSLTNNTGATWVTENVSAGAHSHTFNAEDSHNHTNTTENDHQHTITAASGEPPYYTVQFIFRASLGLNVLRRNLVGVGL